MWGWCQKEGELLKDGRPTEVGYSGFEQGKNNPEMQSVHNVGPIPEGWYTIGGPIDLEGGEHGPYVLTLTPDASNEMFGREGFLIHGDSKTDPGKASKGCIILPRAMRETIADSGDNILWVKASLSSPDPVRATV